MSWDLLKRFFESDVFNQNPFLPVSYLSRYADHVGIHYVLCNKLRQFPYEDIEFFLPQLCHLIISVDNESMALEEFLLDLCEESVTAALLTFWLFQTYLHDLSSNPQSNAFRICRRVYNKVQHIVFGISNSGRHEKIKENVLPVTLLASFVLASVACPILPAWAGPLAVAQARKPRTADASDVETNATTPVSSAKPSRSHTVNSGNTKSRRRRDSTRIGSAPGPPREPDTPTRSPRANHDSRPASSGSTTRSPPEPPRRPSHLENVAIGDARLSSASLPLPDPRSPKVGGRPATPVSAGVRPSEPMSISRRHSHHFKSSFGQAEMTPSQKSRLLRQNYFRCETAFLTALENISNRLVVVPKPARLSALRAELALIAQDLPAEVDVPVICPPTLVGGSPSKSRHHRIVRLNPAEATVLNSAEKVPYLLMVEILRDDFSFDPESQENSRLITSLLAEQGTRKRIFDLSEAPRIQTVARTHEPVMDSVFEPTSGDLGSSPMLEADEFELQAKKPPIPTYPQRVPSSTTTATTAASDKTTPRSSGGAETSRSSSPSTLISAPLRKMTLQNARISSTVDQLDFSALATHMRTASQMLAQLEATSGKRPKTEVAAIRARIIASMQSLEEQSFDLDDGQGPTFDMIMAKATAAASEVPAPHGTAAPADNHHHRLDEELADHAGNINATAGAARMENDFKTGGLQRKGDRDDPSAAVFGEAWDAKRERIRKSSPFGWMKNWDLVSVIVKTGADLRQEAFACQLIQVCHRIWVEAGVPVWVKLMRILVTGESSGLIETIANGVSLHSIKRSLTLSGGVERAGGGERTGGGGANAGSRGRRIATLKDHFVKVFGPPEGEPYRAGVAAFARSLAAYSIISYIFQLKDRHNGNVLIDNEGHIIHIDFGFMLSNSPGSVGFEAAPFKLTHEYVDVLGGVGSPDYEEFKRLCKQAFQALRRSADNIVDLVSMMGRESKMPCFAAGSVQTTAALRQRFQLQLSADEAEQFVETDLIGKSLGSYYTRLYDTFQYRTQGIY